MKELLTAKGRVLREIAKRGGIWHNKIEYQKNLASQLGISYTRIRDLISEAYQDELLIKESHGKYGIQPEVMKFFGFNKSRERDG